MKKLLALMVFLSFTQVFSQTYYECFDADSNPKLRLSIRFENDKAVAVKYKGQKEEIPLVFAHEKMDSQGAHPTVYTTYTEKYRGKTTGKYLITHSGIWDYVEYTRRDRKKFNFTVNLDLSVKDDAFRTTPCY